MPYREYANYYYQDDVPASSQDMHDLVGATREYLVRYGGFSWGGQLDAYTDATVDLDAPQEAGGLYGLHYDEEYQDWTPIVGVDAAPRYSDTLYLPSPPLLVMATSALLMKEVSWVAMSYTESSRKIDPDDEDDPYDLWSLNFGLYSRHPDKNIPVHIDTVELYDEYNDEDDADIRGIARSHMADSPDLASIECATLQELISRAGRRQFRRARRRES